MYGDLTINYLLQNFKFDTVLDVGSGAGQQANVFLNAGKSVTCIDYGNSVYYQKYKNISNNNLKLIIANFNDYTFENTYDLVWCSHILEHQKNVGLFLEKCYKAVSENGLLSITVPPMKSSIVGGHLTVWNTGLLLYNLVINGIDCSKAVCKTYGYNISVIIPKKAKIDIDSLNLSYDKGDIEKLKKFFPIHVRQGFNGNISNINWKN